MLRVLLCALMLFAAGAHAKSTVAPPTQHDDCLTKVSASRYLAAAFPGGLNFLTEDSSGAAFMIDTILRYRFRTSFDAATLLAVTERQTQGGSWVNMLMMKYMAQELGFNARGFIVEDPSELLGDPYILAITTDDRKFWQLVATVDDSYVYMVYQSGDVCRVTRANFVRKYANGRFLFLERPE